MILISPKYSQTVDSVKLIEAARSRNIPTHNVLSSIACYKGMPNQARKNMGIYGERAFAEFAAQELRLNLIQNSLDWLTKIPKSFLKRRVRLMTLKEIKLYERRHNSAILNKSILEPASDHLLFKPAIYQDSFPDVPNSTEILVSDIVNWEVKYRFVVINNKPVSHCCYKFHGIYNDPKLWQTSYIGNEITPEAFISALLDNVYCAPGCIIDIGHKQDVGWGVSGTYPMWSAEMYGCNPNAFVDALIASCQPVL